MRPHSIPGVMVGVWLQPRFSPSFRQNDYRLTTKWHLGIKLQRLNAMPIRARKMPALLSFFAMLCHDSVRDKEVKPQTPGTANRYTVLCDTYLTSHDVPDKCLKLSEP